MHGSISGRLSALCLVGAGLLLSACSDPTAATTDALRSTESSAGTVPPAPPALSSVTIGAPRGAAGAALVGSPAALASKAAAVSQVGGQGMICNVGPGLHIRVPRPQGTQALVQSFETAWWYPRVWRYDGRQWIHYGDVGFIHAKLPSANPRWTLMQPTTVMVTTVTTASTMIM